MDWVFYGLAFIIAVLISASAVYALQWASKNGQLRDFEKGALSIFDENEPAGVPTDCIPAKQTNKRG